MNKIFWICLFGIFFTLIEGQQQFGKPIIFRNNTNSLFFSIGGKTVSVEFKILQGCGDYDCNMTISTISSLTNTATSNLPSSYTFLNVLSNVIGFSIVLLPSSAELSDFTFILPPVAAPAGETFSAFIYDSRQQFGILPTDTAETSFVIEDWFLIRNSFVFARYSNIPQIPLVSSQGYDLTGGLTYNLAFGNGVFLSLIPAYKNAIKMLFNQNNPTGQTFPSGFSSKLFYEIQLQAPTGPQGQINATWVINTADVNGTQLIYFNSKTWTTMSKSTVNSTTSQFTLSTNELAGTWMVATPNSSSSLGLSLSVIFFAVILILS
eukprot:TRINITY_DN203_c0_g1_i1.p1 TRINITY_DN203_c0_g1~~TRINITY_DN203_c0_g1_i1.p1  ORF type:complete len:321 (+),score=117.92 TRINITY_DN203_c0_g1_i1:175-1137(+)